MKNIAIITARGGSKRIPKKNIRCFFGKPIIAYSIEAAINSELFDEIMVSTDSMEIASIAEAYGAEVPFFRSKETSGDFATTSDVLEEVIGMYMADGKFFETICCIYPTAPFVTGKKIREAMDIFMGKNASCVTPVVRFSYPPQRSFVKKGGNIVFQFPEFEKTRSQDLEPIYHDCGQFYIMKTEDLLKYHTIAPPNMCPYEVPEEEVQDIDTESDWKLAEIKYMYMQREIGNIDN